MGERENACVLGDVFILVALIDEIEYEYELTAKSNLINSIDSVRFNE